MAIQKAVRVLVRAVADGELTLFTLDLNTSPYWVGTSGPDAVAGAIVNWFAGASPSSKIPPPTGVKVVNGAELASLDSPDVTIQVPLAEAGELYEVVLDLLFD